MLYYPGTDNSIGKPAGIQIETRRMGVIRRAMRFRHMQAGAPAYEESGNFRYA